ncbi:uncharacterized protein SOCEGT47_048840 [Sorangium cellulosum]|uniref:Probable sensor domain-containing protein n=1 Tax=Sorangium cellulosum TaxID=56 RepID=A0A4P2Q4N5_SORCE|nr:hypothetical protein [Sorangium cellulosum]AUX24347.1 uncharacterized protein SOCEGT47_048840 [Sorangium cellulosum]
MTRIVSPEIFAEHLASQLLSSDVDPAPSKDELREMILVAFYASITKEEGRDLKFVIALVNTETLQSSQSGLDAWCPCVFTQPIDFNVTAVAKPAPAVNPNYSVIAVQSIDKSLKIVGVIRTSRNEYRQSRNEPYPTRLTPWKCLIIKSLGTGQLRVDVGFLYVASLTRGTIVDHDEYRQSRPVAVHKQLYKLASRSGLDEFDYAHVVHRTLLSLPDRGHGGIIIIQHDSEYKYLEGGYRIASGGTNLLDAVHQLGGRDLATSRIHIPAVALTLHTKETEAERQERLDFERRHREIKKELEVLRMIEDATNFAANLASVDGALVLNTNLTIASFGARILRTDDEFRVIDTLHANTEATSETRTHNPIKKTPRNASQLSSKLRLPLARISDIRCIRRWHIKRHASPEIRKPRKHLATNVAYVVISFSIYAQARIDTANFH